MHLSVQVYQTISSWQDAILTLPSVHDHLKQHSTWCLITGMPVTKPRIDSLNPLAQNHGRDDGGQRALWFGGTFTRTCASTNDYSTGLQLAKLADLPNEVLSEAARVTELVEEKHSAQKASSEAGKIAQRRKVFLRVMITSLSPSVIPLMFPVAHSRCCFSLPPRMQLRTQLAQAVEHSMLPDRELLEHFSRIQKETVAALRDTLPT